MLEKIFPKEYFQDRKLLGFSGFMVLMAIVTIARVLIGVRQYDRKVTVGYTQYGADTFQLGEWTTLYEPAIFAFITAATALFVSFRLFNVNRRLSYMVIALQVVVLGFLFVVASALISSASIAS